MKQRNILIALLATLFMSPFAMADGDGKMPTLYGILNKELRFLQVDKATDESHWNVTDVDGFETRVGAKGSYMNEGESYTVKYGVEIGYNSNRDSATDESRIRIRLAYGMLESSWGHVTFGQYWLPSALRFLKMDPFWATTGQSFNLDNSFITGKSGSAALSGTGYIFRGFADQLAYRTPDFAGFNYHVSVDWNNGDYDPNTKSTVANIEHLLNYGQDFGGAEVQAGLLYGHQDREDGGFREDYLNLMAMVALSGFDISLGYGTQKTSDDDKINRLFGALKYSMDKWSYAVSYANADLDYADTNAQKGSESKIAVGAFYQWMENVSLRVLLTQYDVKLDNATSDFDGDGTNDDENSAQTIALGASIHF